jgi:hypothetical protein
LHASPHTRTHQLDADLLAGLQVGAEIDLAEGSAAELAPEAVLARHEQLRHGWWLRFLSLSRARRRRPPTTPRPTPPTRGKEKEERGGLGPGSAVDVEEEELRGVGACGRTP